MRDKIKNIFIIQTIIIVVLMMYILLENKKNNSSLENVDSNVAVSNNKITHNIVSEEKRRYTKTYSVVKNLNMTDETGNYNYYVVKEFQNEEPVIIKVKQSFDLKEKQNYEIILYGTKIEGENYSPAEIFENFEIIDIRETDKTGLDQIQDF